MGNVINIRPSKQTLADVIRELIAEFPEAKSAVVCIFDDGDGDSMHTRYSASPQQLALAGANLLRMAVEN